MRHTPKVSRGEEIKIQFRFYSLKKKIKFDIDFTGCSFF